MHARNDASRSIYTGYVAQKACGLTHKYLFRLFVFGSETIEEAPDGVHHIWMEAPLP